MQLASSSAKLAASRPRVFQLHGISECPHLHRTLHRQLLHSHQCVHTHPPCILTTRHNPVVCCVSLVLRAVIAPAPTPTCPPAISDDESVSGDEDLVVPVAVRTKAAASPAATPTATTKRAAAVASASRNGSKAAVKEDSDIEKDDEDEEDGDEDLEEDEYIVEKICSHMVDKGELRFEVKWEGYEKKTDRTWESEDNLLENASDILSAYLALHGGKEQIMEDSATGLKNKKRGRPAVNAPAPGKRRKGEHPSDSTPPAASGKKEWKPPAGSWEDEVESIDACHDENSGKLIVYLTWKNGQKTQHETRVIYQRCPQKMLAFYERHVKIVAT